MASYASKHASQSLSDRPFLRVQCSQTHNLKTSRRTLISSISKDCYIIGDIFRVFQSCSRNSTGELRPETRMGRFLIPHCVQARICIAIWYVTTLDNKTHAPYNCINCTHQTPALLPTMDRFIRTKLASYSTHCSDVTFGMRSEARCGQCFIEIYGNICRVRTLVASPCCRIF